MNQEQALRRVKKLMAGFPARIPFVSTIKTPLSRHLPAEIRIVGYMTLRSTKINVISSGWTWADAVSDAEAVMQPLINKIARRKGTYP